MDVVCWCVCTDFSSFSFIFFYFFFCQICLRLDMYVWSTGKILSYLVVHPSIHRSTRRTLESFCSESGSFSSSCYIKSFILTCNRQTIELGYRNQVRGWWYGLGNFFLGNVSLHWIPSMYVNNTYSFFPTKCLQNIPIIHTKMDFYKVLKASWRYIFPCLHTEYSAKREYSLRVQSGNTSRY